VAIKIAAGLLIALGVASCGPLVAIRLQAGTSYEGRDERAEKDEKVTDAGGCHD
jgi:hypothetical protein